MKLERRTVVLAAALTVAVAVLVVVGLHSPPVKNAVRRYAISAIEKRLGGRAEVERLDYRLWLGEAQARGVSWSSLDDAVVVRVDEVAVAAASRPLSVRLDGLDIQIRPSPSGSDVETRLPDWLFDIETTVTRGELVFGDLELNAIEARVEPSDGLWEGTLTAGRAQIVVGERAVEADAVSARFRVGPTSAEILESRIEAGASYVAATMSVDTFSPMTAVASMTHSIEGAWLGELVPNVLVDGAIVGDASLQRADDAWTGGGRVDVPAMTLPRLEPLEIHAPWRFEGNVFRIVDAELSGYAGRARLSASADFAADVQEVDIQLDSIDALPVVSSRISGTASGTFEQWDVLSGRGTVDVELLPDRTRSGYPLRGRARLDIDSGVVTVRAPRMTGPGLALGVSGRVGDRVELAYTARVDDVAALDLAPPSLELAGSVSLEGRVEGTLSEPSATAEVTTDGLSVVGVPLQTHASLSWSRQRVELGSASIQHPSGGAMSLHGAYDLEAKTLSLRGIGDDFELRDIPELEARLASISLEVEGPLAALQGSAGMSVENVLYRGVSLPSTDVVIDADGAGVELNGTTQGERWFAARIEARSPYASEIEVALARVPLGEVLRSFPEYSETALEVDGRLIASVDLARPESLRYRVEADQIVGSYRGVGFGVSSPFVAVGDLTALNVTELTLVGADTAIGVDGTLPLSSEGVLDVRTHGVARLELLSAWLPDALAEGTVDLDIRAGGSIDAPTLTGDLIIADVGALVAGVRVEGVHGRARVEGTSVILDNINGELLGGRFRVDGDVPLVENEAVHVRFALDDVDPTIWAEEDQDIALRVSVSGELNGKTSQELELWQGRGQVDSIDARVGTYALGGSEAAPWVLHQGALRLSELRLTGEGTDFAISGQAHLFQAPIAWSARTSGRIDPRIAAPMLADLGMAITGETELDVRASQGPEPLSVEGTMSIKNGRVALRSPPLALTNVTGDLALDNDTLSLVALDANVGGGRLHADGTISLAGASVSSVDLRGVARSVRLSYPDGLRSEIDATVRLSGTPEALTLSGDVALDRAIFSRNINLQSELLESLSRARVVVPVDSLAQRTRLDVRVRTQGLRVDNNLAEMDATANLTVGGTVADPELVGTVVAREGGEFRFGRNTYRIETARIDLERYPLEPPELAITARTTVSDYDIRMSVRGSMDNLTTNLSGTSRKDWREPLTAADAASLLVTGRKVENVSSQGRAILGEQMASYLGASLADLAQFGLGGALPFDIVTVEPSLIAQEDDPSARFTLGAALTETLSVVYSIGLNDAEKQIWIVDYQLPRRMRTQLIRQEDNEFTFALGQQVQLSRSSGSDTRVDPRTTLARVDFYFVSSEPGALEDDARSRLGIDVGQRFDYWKAWERAEKIREWLRGLGFLEATTDLRVAECGVGCAELDVFVLTGKRVRLDWTGDDVEVSLRKTVAAAWDGLMTREFVASDLESLAAAKLFGRRYYQARVRVSVEDTIEETVVSIDVTRGRRGERVVVELTGNERVTDEELRVALPKSTTVEFHELITSKRPRLAQILEVRYASLGFLQASIGAAETSFDDASGVFRVSIPVVEGEPSVVRRVELEGVERLDEAVVRSRLTLVPGGPFRLSQFVLDRSSLAAFYRRQGFPDAEVDSAILPGESPGSLVARFVIHEGPEVTVGDIRLAGNDITRRETITRELALKPGQPLLVSDVSRTQKNLYELGIFRSADVVVAEPNDESDTAVRDVVIEVAEAPALTFDYGARVTTDGPVQVQLDVRAPNLFGRAQGLGFRTLFGANERIFRLSYRTPYVVRYKIATDLFVERRVAEESPGGIVLRERDWTLTAQQMRPLKDRLTLQWSYSFKRTGLGFEDPIIGLVDQTQKQSIFTASVIGDRRNSVVDPSRGVFWSLMAQGAPEFFASDIKFIKVFGQASTFTSLGNGVVWAGGYRVGAINNLGQPLLPGDRFRAGGANSVRGFAQNSLGPPLGGEAVLIVNQELRFPIAWWLRGVGFYDAGNVFASPSDMRLSDLRHDVGVGVRLGLPFGLIRFDWARVIDARVGEAPWRFVFSLGHAF